MSAVIFEFSFSGLTTRGPEPLAAELEPTVTAGAFDCVTIVTGCAAEFRAAALLGAAGCSGASAGD